MTNDMAGDPLFEHFAPVLVLCSGLTEFDGVGNADQFLLWNQLYGLALVARQVRSWVYHD